MRVQNWNHHLVQWAASLEGSAFVWGQTDCHALAGEAFQILFGRRPEIPVWASDREAISLHRSGWSMPEALPRLGATPIPLGFVRCGDLVIEPKAEHFHPVLVALGDSRFLTAVPGESVRIAHLSEVHREAQGWRWPVG